MAESIVVFARFLAKDGKEEEMRAALTAAVAPTRSEPDNIRYDLHQAIDQPAVFFFHEQWRDQAALQRHMATPHFKMLANAVQDLQLEPFSVVITRVIGPAAE